MTSHPGPSPVVDPTELAKRVRAKRKGAGLTLREAGEATGMSAATLSRVESGKHLPDRDRLLRLAAWAGIQLVAHEAQGATEVHGQDAGTVEAVELHLRADEHLTPDDAETLVQLVRTAYERMSQRK